MRQKRIRTTARIIDLRNGSRTPVIITSPYIVYCYNNNRCINHCYVGRRKIVIFALLGLCQTPKSSVNLK